MYEAVAWQGSDSRGFWTKRKKTATSLLAVLALIAGIAVAFKLFDRRVPNNVVRDAATFSYQIHKKDALIGETAYEEAGPAPLSPIFEAGVDTFPGDTRTVDVKITNTNVQPAKDASFQVHVDQATILVTGCYDASGKPLGVVQAADGSTTCPAGATTATPTTVPNSGVTQATWGRWVNFWTLDIDKALVLYADGQELNEDEHDQNVLSPSTSPDGNSIRRYGNACEGGLRTITPASPCQLGTVRAAGKRDALGEQTDIRYYQFKLVEVDDGTDQSGFKGWTIRFDFVFNARLPAIPESGLVGER